MSKLYAVELLDDGLGGFVREESPSSCRCMWLFLRDKAEPRRCVFGADEYPNLRPELPFRSSENLISGDDGRLDAINLLDAV